MPPRGAQAGAPARAAPAAPAPSPPPGQASQRGAQASSQQSADVSEIAEGIFLGSAAAAEDRRLLESYRVSHVLICHPKLPEAHPGRFKYARMPVDDRPCSNLLELLPDALDFLEAARRKGHRTLVHCLRGISRSACCVIALLMFERGFSFEEAWQVCEKQRPIIYPNIGFQQQLRYFEVLLRRLLGSELKPAERLQRLRQMVPRACLDVPGSPLQIQGAISDAVGKAIDALGKLVDQCTTQPDLVNQSRTWQRHGRFWESMLAYTLIPQDRTLVARAKLVAEQLQHLYKSGDASKRSYMRINAIGEEIEAWIQKLQPLLRSAASTSSISIDSGPPRALLGNEYDSSDGEDSSGARSRSPRRQCVPRNSVAMIAVDEGL